MLSLCFADVCTEGDEDLDLGGEEALDSSVGISKRDIHTLNEQRRRDVIKVERVLASFPGLLTPAFVTCSISTLYCKRQTLGT